MLIFADFIIRNKHGNYGKDNKIYAFAALNNDCSRV